MSRTERREEERVRSKKAKREREILKWVSSLSNDKAKYIWDYAHIIADKENKILFEAIERCFSASIIDIFNVDYEKVKEVLNVFLELIDDDTKKVNKIKNECGGDLEMACKKINQKETEVKKMIIKLIGEGVKQKEIIETVVAEFPFLSKAMVTNAYKKTKLAMKSEEVVQGIEKAKDIKAKVENIENPEELNEAVNYIFGDDHKEEVKKESKNDDGLEIIKEVRIVDVRGKYGTYHVEKNVVEIDGLAFMKKEEVKEWASEERAKLAVLMQEINNKECERIRVIQKFM